MVLIPVGISSVEPQSMKRFMESHQMLALLREHWNSVEVRHSKTVDVYSAEKHIIFGAVLYVAVVIDESRLGKYLDCNQ